MSFSDQLEEFMKGIEKPNILTIGRTGVGKTALINAVFGKQLGQSGVPKSLGGITDKFTRYPKDEDALEEVPVILYDSKGFETGKEEEFLKETAKFLDHQKKQGKNEQIHLAWYIVNTASARFEHFDKSVIDLLNKGKVPVIIVLNQWDIAKFDQRQDMRRLIEQTRFQKAYDIIQIAAAPVPFDPLTGQQIAGPFGLTELVSKTVELLPKAYVDAFVAAQLVNIEAKRKIAYNYVRLSASLCYATGYVPIPFTTPLATYLAQQKLAVKLAALFGYEKLKKLPDILVEVKKSPEARGTFWITTIADLFVGNPITSTVAGIAAASYMMVIGMALAATFEDLAKLELEGQSKEDIENLLQEIFRKKFDKYRKEIKLRRKEDIDNFESAFVQGD